MMMTKDMVCVCVCVCVCGEREGGGVIKKNRTAVVICRNKAAPLNQSSKQMSHMRLKLRARATICLPVGWPTMPPNDGTHACENEANASVE
jgi:hypothetical protein